MATGRPGTQRPPPFEVHAFLDASAGAGRTVRFASGARVFEQGGPATSVFYIQTGRVRLSVVSEGGREAIVAMLSPGDFFGEGCLGGQTLRMGTATALGATTVLRIARREMVRLLHEQPAFSDRFLAHMLARNIRIEQDLVDQLFNSSEKRLARALLLLARYSGTTRGTLSPISQETLAEIVGTTRPRINFFMKKFERLGLISYDGGLTINPGLLSVVLHAVPGKRGVRK